MANHNLTRNLFRKELVLLIRVGQLERLEVGLPLGIVGICNDKLTRVARSAQLALDVHADTVALFLRRNPVLKVNRERGTHPVLDVVNVVNRNLFVEFDVVNRAYVIRLRVVERPRRERLYVENLRRKLDVHLLVEAVNFYGFFALIAPVFGVIIRFYNLILVNKAAADVFKWQVRDVCDRSAVEAPIHLEGEAALYLEVQTSLAEFVVQIPLVKRQSTF